MSVVLLGYILTLPPCPPAFLPQCPPLFQDYEMDKAALRLRVSYPRRQPTRAQRANAMRQFAQAMNIPLGFFLNHPVGRQVWREVEEGLVSEVWCTSRV